MTKCLAKPRQGFEVLGEIRSTLASVATDTKRLLDDVDIDLFKLGTRKAVL